MDLRITLYALGVAMLVASLLVDLRILSVIGVAFMIAAIVYGWFRKQREIRAIVRETRRRNRGFPSRGVYPTG